MTPDVFLNCFAAEELIYGQKNSLHGSGFDLDSRLRGNDDLISISLQAGVAVLTGLVRGLRM